MPHLKNSIVTFIIVPLIIGVLYFLLFLYISNYDLVNKTLIGKFSYGDKKIIILSLISGAGTSLSSLNLTLLIITSLLTGFNLSLLLNKLSFMKSQGRIKLIVGGSSLLGLVSSGCASCGIPIITLLGLGGSIGFLPFKGYEFSILTILLLLYSSFSLLKNINEKPVCKIE